MTSNFVYVYLDSNNVLTSFKNLTVDGNINVAQNNLYSLGSKDNRFKELFVSAGSIDMGGTVLSSITDGGIKISNSTDPGGKSISISASAGVVIKQNVAGQETTITNVGGGIDNTKDVIIQNNLNVNKKLIAPYVFIDGMMTVDNIKSSRVSGLELQNLSIKENSIIPLKDNFYSLGSSTHKFKDLHLSGNTLYIGDTKLHTSAEKNIIFQDGIQTKTLTVTGTTTLKDNVTIVDGKNLIVGNGTTTLNGNVGIGLNTPIQKLHVDGSIKATQSIICSTFEANNSNIIITKASIIPYTDNIYSLGSQTKTFKDVYVGTGSLYVNGKQVIHDNSGTITIKTEENQNLSLQTAGSGNLQLTTTGSGIIQVKKTLQITDGQKITSFGGDKVVFGNNINVEGQIQGTSLSLDGSTSISSTKLNYLNINSTGNAEASKVLVLDASRNITNINNLTITGALTVHGTNTNINSTTVSVADSMFKYAKDNTANSLDFGFYGQYVDNSTTKYGGIFYNADNSKFHTFIASQVEPNTTVDTDGIGYTKGDIVCGDINITSLTTSSGSGSNGQILSNTGSGLSWISSSSTWTTSNNDIYYNTGNVGIGTTPTYKLDIAGETRTIGTLRITPSQGDSNLNFSSGADERISSSFGHMWFVVNAGNRMIILSSGNVGIGLTTPIQKLHVDGSIKATQSIICSTFEANNSNIIITKASIIPYTDNIYSLGSQTKTFKDVYVGTGSLYVNGKQVIHDNSGTITIKTEENQNLSLQTAGSGNLQLTTTGSGIIQVKKTLQITDGQKITSFGGDKVVFGNNINVEGQIQGTSLSLDGSTSISSTKLNYLNINSTGNAEASKVLVLDASRNITNINNLTITGALTVHGTNTNINSTTVSVADSMFKYAKDNTANSLDFGFYGQYVDNSTTKYGGIFYNADNSKFHTFIASQVEPNTTVDTDGIGYTKGDIVCGDINITSLTTSSGSGSNGQILSSTGSGLSWINNTTYTIGDGGLTQKNFTTDLNTKLTNLPVITTIGSNLDLTGGTLTATNTTYSIGDGGLTQKNFTTSLNTKLTDLQDITTIGSNLDLTGGTLTATILLIA